MDDDEPFPTLLASWVLLVSMVVNVVAFSVAAYFVAVILGFGMVGSDVIALLVAVRLAYWSQRDHEDNGMSWPWDPRYRKGKDQ